MRIVVADDHTLFRTGLILLLHRLYGELQVQEAKDLDGVLRCLDGGGADVVLLDLGMPGMDGLAGLDMLHRRAPGVPVVILSEITEPAEMLRAIRFGARGFIPKTASDQVLKHAIALVLSGETFVPSSAVLDPGRDGRARPPRGAAGGPPAALTGRQREVLALVAQGRSNKEIASALGLLESTVKTHMKTILSKLGATNRTQAAMLAAELGLAGERAGRS